MDESDRGFPAIKITRDDARAKGLARYFTWERCKNGHLDQRMVSSGRCRACIREATEKAEKVTKPEGPNLTDLIGSLFFGTLGPNYTETDCYRDFRKVFLGSEEGKRVFFQIVQLGGILAKSFDANPHVHAYNAGASDFAKDIVRRTYIEPPAKPTRQNVRKEQNA